MDNLITDWEKVSTILQEQLSPMSYNTWIKTIIPCDIRGTNFYLQVANEIVQETINTKYLSLLQDAIFNVTGTTYNVKLILSPNDIDEPADSIISKKSTSSTNGNNAENSLVNSNLNPKYVFDTFVVGNSNRMAHAASLAVAESPAKSYNPLFLYGNSGLGKTHLMHSIAHYILSEEPSTKVLYVTSETFTNELIYSIQTNKNETFRNKYRNIDVLLIDDIQFISKKEGTQEEFFHTFNALYEASKQIIISSDRPPKDIETLEDRLKTRFGRGLVTDIQSPDYETRIAILNNKASTDCVNVPEDVVKYIANNIVSNIRELEGALTKVTAFSRLSNTDITIALAEESLKDILSDNVSMPLTIQLIQEVVSDYFNISVEQIQGNTKPKHIAFPRQIAMYLSRKLLDISLPKIGESFGGRDHTTVMHAVKKIAPLVEDDADFNEDILKIEERINSLTHGR